LILFFKKNTIFDTLLRNFKEKGRIFMSTLAASTFNGIFSATLPAPITYSYDKTLQKMTPSSLSTLQKVQYYVFNLFKLPLCLAALPTAMTLTLLNSLKNKIIGWIFFQEPLQEKVLSDPELSEILAKNIGKVGPADSLFQSCGLGTDFSRPKFKGKCEWNESVNSPQGHIKGDPKELQNSYRNYLDDPSTLIKILKEMNVTAYRFSLERSVIEDRKNHIDKEALKKHINFCKALIAAGIEPWVTLDHFVRPLWFARSGGFANEDNVDNFVQYCCKIIPILKNEAGVSRIMTFNEFNNDLCNNLAAMRGISESFPYPRNPGLGLSFKTIQNMQRAHCTIYERIKGQDALAELKDVKLGESHQLLPFKSATGNLIERIVCFVLSFFSHYFSFTFLQTGSFQVPFFMNTKIITNKKPLDFLGVQTYGFPRFIFTISRGNEPGDETKLHKIKIPFTNFYLVTGATSTPGGAVQSFGPAVSPEDLRENLLEAQKIGVPLAITETGIDANCCYTGEKGPRFTNYIQKNYYQRIFPILAKFKLEGFFFWTLFRGQHEWENGVGDSTGKGILLGLIDAKKDSNGCIRSWNLSSAAKYVQNVFQGISLANARRAVAG
jgi:beta-glucosidase/6-phospho-beta-glucosidase/beta-galactosidase